jgi:KAP family P-loop domain
VAQDAVKASSAVKQGPSAGPEDLVPGLAPPSLRMLADRPLDDEREDRLGFVVYAQALAELIDHPGTHTPLTIAVSAPWGAGKTSLARLVAYRLAQWRKEWGQPPHIVCWFNAWAHDDATHLGAAFAADVARTVDRKRSWWRRLRLPLPAAMLSPRDRWRRRVLIGLATLAVAVGLAFVPQVRSLFEDSPGADLDKAFGARVGAIAFFLAVIFAVWKYVLAAAERAAHFIDDPGSEAARGSMKDVSDELGRLIRDATRGRRKLVVFVDDLERCRPPRALEVCEAAGNLLAHPDVVTVLIADMRVVASSAELKYRQLESADDEQKQATGDYGRRYLQKIVQIQFDLPPATEERVREMLVSEARSEPALHGALGATPPRDRGRLGRFVDVGLPVLGVGLPLIVGIYFAINPPAASDDRGGAFLAGFLGAVFVLFLIGAIGKAAIRLGVRGYKSIQSQRAARHLRAIDESITKHAKNESAAPGSVEFLVNMENKIAEDSPEAKLVADRVARYFTHESPLKDEAEAEIVHFLPLIPRSAKRMMNHLRLRLYVSIRRDMLADGSQLTARHLGKWVVLEERWPELVRGLVARPDKLTQLEQAGELGALAAKLEELDLEADASDDLLDFVRTEPRLGAVAEQLIFLEPART